VALAVIAVFKITVLGSLGMQAWQELSSGEFLPLPKALAGQVGGDHAPAPPALAPSGAPGAGDHAPGTPGSLELGANADPEMLAASSIPGAKVPESQENKSANRREAELTAKERALTAMEKSIDDKLAELKRVEGSIKKLLDDADVLKDARIKRQVDTYAAMKPKQAAEVLSNMDQELAVKILTGMKPKMAGEIMTFVKTDKAAKLTEAMTKVQAPMQGPGQ
jgi:flagellar motility protein MotE (MotC chaperone)